MEQLSNAPTRIASPTPTDAFGAETPFLLLARCHVKPECLDDYLAAAKVADAAVQESEPGMLHHTFDVDPNDPLAFVWSEVYADDAALLKHLTNPPLVKFVEQHGEMGDDFSIEVYGTLSDETKKAFSATGFPIKYFDSQLGYSRVGVGRSYSKAKADAFGAETPFLLLARCHVKPECLDDYLAAAKVADAAVQESEPGMLHHTFDVDPNDPLAFVWSEVYADDAALLKHLTNPPLVKFVEQHGEMGDDFSIEVYGTLSDETKKAFSATGFPIKYFDSQLGYSRVVSASEVPTKSVDARLQEREKARQQMAKFADTTFTAFTPSPAPAEPLPVFLFQSGYGSSSVGHQPLLQKIADAGFVVVVPDRESDTAGGKESVGTLFSEGKVVSALSTDGTHLAAALEWVQAQKEVGGCKLDLSKVAAGGFSMGAIEAIRFATASADVVKAVAVISSSTSAMAEPLYEFTEAEMLLKASQFAAPSLWISSDKDLQLAATKALYESAATPAAFVSFKDEVLDNSMALTDATSIWSPAVDEMVPGLKQHFALAAEAGVVSDVPIVAFLKQHMLGAPAAPLAAEGATAELLSK